MKKHLGWIIFGAITALGTVLCLVNRSLDGAAATLGFASMAAFFIALVQFVLLGFKPKPRPSRGVSAIIMGAALGGFVLAGVFSVNGPKPAATAATSSAPKVEAASRPDVAPVDAAPHELSRQEQKTAFLKTVDESVSGARIAGNMYKFVGKHVDIHCVVDSVPDKDLINATCPPNEYGMGPSIVVLTDSRGLEKDQRIRVIGTVQDPADGSNAMGGEMKYPTVKAEFME